MARRNPNRKMAVRHSTPFIDVDITEMIAGGLKDDQTDTTVPREGPRSPAEPLDPGISTSTAGAGDSGTDGHEPEMVLTSRSDDLRKQKLAAALEQLAIVFSPRTEGPGIVNVTPSEKYL